MKTTANPVAIVVKLALAGVFAALVCVATLTFRVDVPATGGYFNVGETVIYVAALLFGPLVGGFSGGVGAAVADMFAYAEFAPGTFVVKGLEGIIVGYLGKKLFTNVAERNWKAFTAVLAVVVGSVLAVTGSTYYVGDVPLYFGYPQPSDPTLVLSIPPEAWYMLGGIIALLLVFTAFKIGAESGRAILSMIIGGLEMVAGYFLYEQLILGRTGAIAEIPVNVAQIVIGLVVALPITRIVMHSLPQLKS
jgi:uncharacterized membrane protein